MKKKLHHISPANKIKYAIYTSILGNYFFTEVGLLIAEGLTRIGYKTVLGNERSGFIKNCDWHIVIAPHEFFYVGKVKGKLNQLPTNLILVNTEQPSTGWFRSAAEYFPKAMVIWDIDYLTSVYIVNKGYRSDFLPLGYLENSINLNEVKKLPKNYGTCFLESTARNISYLNQPLKNRPIDILFIGNLTPKREKFFLDNILLFSQYRCYLHFSDYSKPILAGNNTFMDTQTVIGLTQRTKIVLNIHRGDDLYFEWIRNIMHGMWHKTLIISENSGQRLLFQPNKHFIECSLQDMPKKIKYLLSTNEGQKQSQVIALAGFERLRTKYNLENTLRHLLNKL